MDGQSDSRAHGLRTHSVGDPLPPGWTAFRREPDVSNGGVTSFGREAWESFDQYKPRGVNKRPSFDEATHTRKSARVLYNRIKKAEDPPVTPGEAWDKREMLHRLALTAMTGGGLGVLGGTLVGLKNRLQAPAYDPLIHSSPVNTPMEVYVDPAKKKRLPQPQTGFKAASFSQETEMPPAGRFQDVANLLPKLHPTQPFRYGGFPMPAQAAAFAMPMVGGFSLANWLMNKRKKQELGNELDMAEDDFHKSLGDEYEASLTRKKADADEIGKAIDALYDKLKEKKANPVTDALGTASDVITYPYRALFGDSVPEQYKGVVGTGVLGAGALGGYLGYKYTKDQSPEEALRKAIRLRARQRQIAPTAPYAIPAQIEHND